MDVAAKKNGFKFFGELPSPGTARRHEQSEHSSLAIMDLNAHEPVFGERSVHQLISDGTQDLVIVGIMNETAAKPESTMNGTQEDSFEPLRN